MIEKNVNSKEQTSERDNRTQKTTCDQVLQNIHL